MSAEELLFKKYLFIYVCECFVFICLCTTNVHGAHRGQKTPSDTLEMKLQMAVSHMLVLGIESRFSVRTASALNL